MGGLWSDRSSYSQALDARTGDLGKHMHVGLRRGVSDVGSPLHDGPWLAVAEYAAFLKGLLESIMGGVEEIAVG